jgi:hypothetical protein
VTSIVISILFHVYNATAYAADFSENDFDDSSMMMMKMMVFYVFSSTLPYECIECAEMYETFKVSIRHIIEYHSSLELRHRDFDGQSVKITTNYKVTAELCTEHGRTKAIDDKK